MANDGIEAHESRFPAETTRLDANPARADRIDDLTSDAVGRAQEEDIDVLLDREGVIEGWVSSEATEPGP